MKHKLIIGISVLCLGLVGNVQAQNKRMYRKGWIDFNKNGVKDIYEDPSQPVEKRVADLLSQMSVEEKTCQLATLYGYGRVLKDSLPVAGWKNEIWKDGIANIDEMLNGVGKKSALVPDLLYPFSNHAEAVNTVQRWFVEETRLGIPVDFTNEGIHGLNHTKATPLPEQRACTSCRRHRRAGGESVGIHQCVRSHTGCSTRSALGTYIGVLWRRTFSDSGSGNGNGERYSVAGGSRHLEALCGLQRPQRRS